MAVVVATWIWQAAGIKAEVDANKILVAHNKENIQRLESFINHRLERIEDKLDQFIERKRLGGMTEDNHNS